jgi:hypothetical protein
MAKGTLNGGFVTTIGTGMRDGRGGEGFLFGTLTGASTRGETLKGGLL